MKDRLKFKAMLEQYPDLSKYWNFEEWKASIKTADDLPLSSGEKILMTFFLSVWFGRNVDFDITRAAGVLSTENKMVIANWLLDPFWP
ncbi:hypothetical protein C7B09_25645 [Escherichia albertii]|uniref:Uncharacterized protein n=1 Tax=Escherichia albertii TaxID=208962 RepID=A0ABX5HA70_ESCAL|nr:hypothetical protein [Escherichia albertii]PSY35139.1 hypothetical protein C7B09_25645 [Escherichia albertii]